MTTQKRQWIEFQSQALSITNPNDLWSHLTTTSVEVENTDPRDDVPKPLSILEVAQSITPNDRRLLMGFAYQSLLTNINKGDMLSVAADIQNLATTPEITQATIDTLNAILTAPPQTEPDPNWKPTKLVLMYVAAGFTELTLGEVVEALFDIPFTFEV